jgi:hypothetical protein
MNVTFDLPAVSVKVSVLSFSASARWLECLTVIEIWPLEESETAV